MASWAGRLGYSIRETGPRGPSPLEVPLLLLAWTGGAALAGAFWLEGASGARSVLVLPDGRPEQVAVCADDGQGGDPVPGDGVWRCSGPDASPAEWRVLLDGSSLVVVRGQAPAGDWGLSLREGEGTLLAQQAPTRTPGTPRPALAAMVMEVDRGPIQQAPVVDLLSHGARAQLTCRDDGRFPDRAQNDAVAACAGPAPGQLLEVRVRGGWEEQVFTLNYPADAALMQARLTATGLQADRWVLAPEGQAGAPQGAPPAPPVEGGVTGGEGARPEGGGGPPGGALGVSVVLAGLTGAAAYAVGRRSRRSGLPVGLVWAQAAARPTLEERVLGPEGLDGLVRECSRQGLVVAVVGDAPLPAGEPGPVLRATSEDALVLADALSALRRGGDLRGITVLVLGPDRIVSPGEVGLSPLERLLGDAPPGVRVLLVHGGTGSEAQIRV